MPASGPSTPILFLHGCWHGSWSRAEVLVQVTGVGARGLASRPPPAAGAGLRRLPPGSPGSDADRGRGQSQLGRRKWETILASESGPEAGAEGVVEDVKGRAKEAAGAVTGNESLKKEGEAQQDKAAAQRDVAAKEAEAEKARAQASAAEAEQRSHQ
jgi:uncharacterized protein YjbJ (UPF0337 family)